MGYTHYWQQKRTFSKADWKTAADDVAAIWTEAMAEGLVCGDHDATVPNTPADIRAMLDDGTLYANGFRGDAHEKFCLYRQRQPLPPWRTDKASRGWDFCKTARKPYDVAVTATLCYLESYWEKHIVDVASDGDGLELARRALPRLANILHIPRVLAFEAQFSRFNVHAGRYWAATRIDGAFCIGRDLEVLTIFPAGDCARQVSEALSEAVSKVRERLRHGAPAGYTEKENARVLHRFEEAAPLWGGRLPDEFAAILA